MTLFRQPYPYYYYRTSLLRLAVIIFVLVFLFLFAFKPFVVNPAEQRVSYWLICLIHAALPTAIFCVYFLIRNAILSETQKERWTLGMEITHLCILFFLLGIASFLVRDIIYTNPDNWSWHYLFEEVKNTFLAGTLISSFLSLLNFYRLYSRSQRQAARIDSHLHPSNKLSSQTIPVTTNLKSDDFSVELNTFLFARASGNYVEIYVKENNRVSKSLKRLTLAQLETQLLPHILRTHRSYLVNIRHIVHVSGNAQGYELQFADTDLTALVSRGNIPAFDAAVK